jgi:hypothetical protein
VYISPLSESVFFIYLSDFSDCVFQDTHSLNFEFYNIAFVQPWTLRLG